MKAQVLFDAYGHVISMLIPVISDKHPAAALPRAVFRPGPAQRAAELEIPAEFEGLRLLEIQAAVAVDLAGAQPAAN